MSHTFSKRNRSRWNNPSAKRARTRPRFRHSRFEREPIRVREQEPRRPESR